MKLDDEVIRDLLTLYLAGEASPATRRLVEEELRAHPQLARLAREARGPNLPPAVAAPSPASAEKRALDATRRRLRRRSWVLAGAIFTSLLPFSLAFSEEGVRFVLLRDAPATAALSLLAAAALWIAHWRLSQKLRVTGL